MRDDLAGVLADLEDDIGGSPFEETPPPVEVPTQASPAKSRERTTPAAAPQRAASVEGEIVVRAGAAAASREQDDDDDDPDGYGYAERDDSDLHVSGETPLGRYPDRRAARREFQKLQRNNRKLSRDIVLFLFRGGPEILGLSPAEAVMEIKNVAKSQAYRDIYLLQVTERLAVAAGLSGDEGIAQVLDIDGVNAKSASDILKPRLPEIEARIAEQASNPDVTQDELANEVLPRVVRNIIDEAKAPSVPDPDHDSWGAGAAGPADPYAEDRRADAATGTGEGYGAGHEEGNVDAADPAAPAAPAAVDERAVNCVACHGNGRIPKGVADQIAALLRQAGITS